MPKSSKAARLVTDLDGWQDRELEELVAIVEGLLESRQSEVREAGGTGDGKSSTTVKTQGHLELKTINGYGPYRYLRYRQDGKLKSQYLGKA